MFAQRVQLWLRILGAKSLFGGACGRNQVRENQRRPNQSTRQLCKKRSRIPSGHAASLAYLPSGVQMARRCAERVQPENEAGGKGQQTSPPARYGSPD